MQWHPTDGRIGTPWPRSLRLALSVQSVAFAFSPLTARTMRSSRSFGKPTQVITTPGLGFKHPWQSVRTFDHRLFVYAAPPSEFLTLEKTPVVASGTILWRVADPKRYFETVVDRKSAESRLGDILSAELGAAIGSNRLVAFVSMDASSLPGGCHRRRDCSSV